MHDNIKITPNKTQNEEHKIACSECVGITRHKVLQSIDVDGHDDYGSWDFFYSDNFQIIQCQGCDFISFRKFHIDSEDQGYDDNGEPFNLETIEIYPSRIAGRQKLNDSHFLPLNIRQIYAETHTALCSRQPILAVIGIRALVETVCKDNGATGGNLEQRIDNLIMKGVLTTQNAELLHSLRILGNEGAHEVKIQDEKTLGLAMTVVEQLLNNVYILPAITAKLPKRGSTASLGNAVP